MIEEEVNTDFEQLDDLKIKAVHRRKLKYYLDVFYELYKNEKYTIFHCVKYFKGRLKKNKDAWCAVCGETGSGKSLFALMTMILHGRPMSLKKNVAYVPRGNEIVSLFDKLRFQCLLVDEAAREMRSVNWQSKAQQGVNVKAMTDRFMRNWVFLNMPNFNEFTKSMRRGNLLFRFIVLYRTETHARIVLQRKSRNWRDEDPWGDNNAMKIYERAEKKHRELSNETILALERTLPCTVMDFMIPNLELILPELCERYEALKSASRKVAALEDSPTDKTRIWKDKLRRYKHRMAHLVYYNQLGLGQIKVTKDEICKSLGISNSMLNKYLNTPLPEDKKEQRKEIVQQAQEGEK